MGGKCEKIINSSCIEQISKYSKTFIIIQSKLNNYTTRNQEQKSHINTEGKEARIVC